MKVDFKRTLFLFDDSDMYQAELWINNDLYHRTRKSPVKEIVREEINKEIKRFNHKHEFPKF
ncbi:hypothetical protein [Lonepinella sp. MS14436]|uniref:hypothetical protein n=1 Tax=Lonepinella sp. MS14436 TaxID=3003619 RepID=UPI0036DB8B2E